MPEPLRRARHAGVEELRRTLFAPKFMASMLREPRDRSRTRDGAGKPTVLRAVTEPGSGAALLVDLARHNMACREVVGGPTWGPRAMPPGWPPATEEGAASPGARDSNALSVSSTVFASSLQPAWLAP